MGQNLIQQCNSYDEAMPLLGVALVHCYWVCCSCNVWFDCLGYLKQHGGKPKQDQELCTASQQRLQSQDISQKTSRNAKDPSPAQARSKQNNASASGTTQCLFCDVSGIYALYVLFEVATGDSERACKCVSFFACASEVGGEMVLSNTHIYVIIYQRVT